MKKQKDIAQAKKYPCRPSPPFNSKGVRQIDKGIRNEVRILWENGIETFESCEGGKGHSFLEPTVRFHGTSADGFRALAIALQHGLNVDQLRRFYSIQNGEAHGPYWEITFYRKPKK